MSIATTTLFIKLVGALPDFLLHAAVVLEQPALLMFIWLA
jgi:hypothetical protein